MKKKLSSAVLENSGSLRDTTRVSWSQKPTYERRVEQVEGKQQPDKRRDFCPWQDTLAADNHPIKPTYHVHQSTQYSNASVLKATSPQFPPPNPSNSSEACLPKERAVHGTRTVKVNSWQREPPFPLACFSSTSQTVQPKSGGGV